MGKRPDRSLRILSLSPEDGRGGAEQIALLLHRAYKAEGYDARLAVGRKTSSAEDTLALPHDPYRTPWARFLLHAAARMRRVNGAGGFPRRAVKAMAEPIRTARMLLGHEDFQYPASGGLLDLFPDRPSILHAHNLHGSYFDLRALPLLSSRIPTVVTLHDAWLLSGHCAHSFDCERWKTGCGKCPDLNIYPSIRRDATAYNWRRKSRLFETCRLFVATPCRWLMDKVEHSMLQQAVAEKLVIPNGIDLDVFRPGDKQQARHVLGLSRDAVIVLYTGRGIRDSVWRDYAMLVESLRAFSGRHEKDVLFLAVGEERPDESVGRIRMRFPPFEPDPVKLVHYYRAADVYVQPSRADTFPTSVLEALACGTPVIATAVGGIPEQVRSLGVGSNPSNLKLNTQNSATGILTEKNDAEAFAGAMNTLVGNRELRLALSENAHRDAADRFDIRKQAGAYVTWFREILSSPHAGHE
ncbi:MAG: glycosyltransferase [Nitrospirae bacterium]|nr:glycosyltransferase [Nitrospirota bacterium]